jgi:hypothetical protein
MRCFSLASDFFLDSSACHCQRSTVSPRYPSPRGSGGGHLNTQGGGGGIRVSTVKIAQGPCGFACLPCRIRHGLAGIAGSAIANKERGAGCCPGMARAVAALHGLRTAACFSMLARCLSILALALAHDCCALSKVCAISGGHPQHTVAKEEEAYSPSSPAGVLPSERASRACSAGQIWGSCAWGEAQPTALMRARLVGAIGPIGQQQRTSSCETPPHDL